MTCNETTVLQALSVAQEIQDWFEKNEKNLSDLLGSHEEFRYI